MTVGGVRRVLRKVLNNAVAWELMDRNPVLRVKAPRVESTEMRTWSAHDARRFLDQTANDRLHALWVLAITTGMRRGELAGLRWIDVNLDFGVIALRNTRVAVQHAVHEYEPKSRTSRRSVAIDSLVVTVLRSHRRRQLEERLAWGAAYNDSGYVFTNEDGQALHPNRITLLFRRRRDQLGLPAVRLHDLRHTSASLMLAAGVHPKVVSERLGHSSSDTSPEPPAARSPATSVSSWNGRHADRIAIRPRPVVLYAPRVQARCAHFGHSALPDG